jgi:hypothetical protein
MDYQKPDPENGSGPTGPRVEDDFVRSLRPAKTLTRRRLPAALPFAIAGILVVSSIAFGATVVRSIVTPTSSATPVIVGDDETDAPVITEAPVTDAPPTEAPVTDAPVITAPPTKTPTKAPTKAPTKTDPPAANPADLGTLSATDNGNGSYKFCWNAYTGGTQFNYYKLSGVAYPGTPGYAEGAGYWEVINPGTTCVNHTVAAGTWNVNVEAIYYPSGPAVALAKTSTLKLCVTGTTKTAPPVATLVLRLDSVDPMTASPKGVHLSWDAYTGPYLNYYGIVRVNDTGMPTLSIGQTPTPNFGVTAHGWTDTNVVAGHTYTYKLWAFSDQTYAAGVVPNCQVATILGASNTVTVTIPEATPTPPPASVAPPTPSTSPAPSISPTS